jgi:hypothetical protein
MAIARMCGLLLRIIVVVTHTSRQVTNVMGDLRQGNLVRGRPSFC